MVPTSPLHLTQKLIQEQAGLIELNLGFVPLRFPKAFPEGWFPRAGTNQPSSGAPKEDQEELDQLAKTTGTKTLDTARVQLLPSFPCVLHARFHKKKPACSPFSQPTNRLIPHSSNKTEHNGIVNSGTTGNQQTVVNRQRL